MAVRCECQHKDVPCPTSDKLLCCSEVQIQRLSRYYFQSSDGQCPVVTPTHNLTLHCYRGADKSLTRPGRKQARKHVRRRARFQRHRDASCHQVFFSPSREGAEGNSRHSYRNINFFPSW